MSLIEANHAQEDGHGHAFISEDSLIPTPMLSFTNSRILSRSHAAIKAKARKKSNQLDQIAFDESARLSVSLSFKNTFCQLTLSNKK